WEAAQDIDGDEHPYLARKGVNAYGLRIGVYRGIKNSLLVPVRLIDGELVTLQAIFEQPSAMMEGRDRDYLPGGQKRGGFHMLGDKPHGSEPVILVGSGYATCASAHMATGYPAAVAFDDGNMHNVALALRNTYPMAVIIILADDDQWHDDPNKPNSGRVNGVRAAQMAQAMLAIPMFSDTSGKPTDFNDLHQLDGLAAVRAQIIAALPKKAANDNGPRVPLDSPVLIGGYPHVSGKGSPLNTVENLEYMLVEYGISVRYNIVRKMVEVDIPGRDYGDDLDANCTLAEINSMCARNSMPKSDTQDYIKLISSKNRYNPVEDFISSRPWDGQSRFGDLASTLQTPDDYPDDLKMMLLRKWLISAAAAALKPRGFWSKGVLVLQGAQSEGKTSWIKSLLPPELRKLLKVGATIDTANKDSISSAISHWLVELGELDGTFRKSDIARLKGFISQDIDQLRRPYDRLESEYQRRTVFFASVNPKVFLVDDTGNVRWWTIPVLSLDLNHGIDVQQLWAEAAHYYARGENWWLDREQEARLEIANAEHQEPNTIEELMLSKFNPEAIRSATMTASEALIAIGFDRPTNAQAKNAGVVLRKHFGEPKRSNGRWVWMMPARHRDAVEPPL
uniref:VapE domain-containing protein n=1 Tax=Aquabacterium sp. TaxID=1872578 RepID=UPI0025BC5CB0